MLPFLSIILDLKSETEEIPCLLVKSVLPNKINLSEKTKKKKKI